MAKIIAGIDISDGLLTAVVVDRKGNENTVKACAYVSCDDPDLLGECCADLFAKLQWQEGTCVVGLPLSICSLRTLTLPFTDQQKISQVLPLELEDQLVVPTGEQIVEHVVVGEKDSASLINVICIEKDELRSRLTHLQGVQCDSEIVTPGLYALAQQLLSGQNTSHNFLLLYAQFHSFSMALVHEGRIVFLRNIPYPEEMFTNPPFVFSNSTFMVKDEKGAEICIEALCQAVVHSIDYFRHESELAVQPERVYLSGPLARIGGFPEKIHEKIGLQVEHTDLCAAINVARDPEIEELWQPGFYDRALSLAMTRAGQKRLVNFRKGEFARPRKLFASKRQRFAAISAMIFLGVVLIVGLAVDVQKRTARYEKLNQEMVTIFQSVFPDVTRVVDPYAQMQARLREAKAPTVTMPLFSMDKRVLRILDDISTRVPPSLTMHVSRLVIDQQSVQIKGTTDAFNNVDAIKVSLAGSPDYADVDIVSATADNKKGMIRFEIRLQLREES